MSTDRDAVSSAASSVDPPQGDWDELSTTERLELVDGPSRPPTRQCPDGGTCHHECQVGCFRVLHAGPLSGVYTDDEWPDYLTEWARDLEPATNEPDAWIIVHHGQNFTAYFGPFATHAEAADFYRARHDVSGNIHPIYKTVDWNRR